MTMFILFAALGPAPEMARPVRIWSYKDMLKESDLVILGAFDSERADGEPIDADLKRLEKAVEGLTTKLRVLGVLKGELKDSYVAVRHHRLRPNEGVVNGPSFAEFKKGPDYLVFLKKRTDGRYECVTGQMDPEFAVKRVEPPSWGEKEPPK